MIKRLGIRRDPRGRSFFDTSRLRFHELPSALPVISSPNDSLDVGRSGRPDDLPGGHEPGMGDRRTGKCLAGGQPAEPRFVMHRQSLCRVAAHSAEQYVLFLDWDPKQENTDVETFREKILLPVLSRRSRRIAASRSRAGRSTTWSTPATFLGAFASTRTSRRSRPCWRNRSRERQGRRSPSRRSGRLSRQSLRSTA